MAKDKKQDESGVREEWMETLNEIFANEKNQQRTPEEKEAALRAADQIFDNLATTRQSVLSKFLIDRKADINEECGYPDYITADEYKQMYERNGVAARVVNIFPRECWSIEPEITENEEVEETEFEKQLSTLNKTHRLFHYLQRVDELSGIGHYGVLLFGVSDGKELREPIDGFDEKTGRATTPKDLKVLFLRPFDESTARIQEYERDKTSARYGLPKMYSLTFIDLEVNQVDGASPHQETIDVHWTRVVHIADNKQSSEVFGTPRMKRSWDRLVDLRKLYGGSGEMFWKGGFPGYSFEVNPDHTDQGVVLDKEAMREEFFKYSQGLQRYLAITGVTAKSLAPQVADPTGHIDVQIEAICIAEEVPKRIFCGSEAAHLASSQDKRSWNEKLARRQNQHLTPFVLYPVLERLMDYGALPFVEEFDVTWPDLNTQTDHEQAEVLNLIVSAVGKYVQSGASSLIPPELFLKLYMGLEEAEIEEILQVAEERMAEEDALAEEEEEFDTDPDEEAEEDAQSRTQ